MDHASTKLNHWAFEVSGSKPKVDYGISEILEMEGVKDNPKLCPASKDALVSKEPDVDSCRYGTFHEMFQVDLSFKRAIKRIGPVNGIFYALFQPEEKQVDDGFD